MECENDLTPKLASVTLIRLARVGIAVAEHHFPGIQGGKNNFMQALGAVREHETEFGQRSQPGAFRIKQQGADAVADLRAARLAGGEKVASGGLQMLAEPLNLSGFPSAVEAFEGHEKTVSGSHNLEFNTQFMRHFPWVCDHCGKVRSIRS